MNNSLFSTKSKQHLQAANAYHQKLLETTYSYLLLRYVIATVNHLQMMRMVLKKSVVINVIMCESVTPTYYQIAFNLLLITVSSYFKYKYV